MQTKYCSSAHTLTSQSQSPIDTDRLVLKDSETVARVSNWRLNLSINWLLSGSELISHDWLSNKIDNNVLTCHINLYIFSTWLYYCCPPRMGICFLLGSPYTVFAFLSPFVEKLCISTILVWTDILIAIMPHINSLLTQSGKSLICFFSIYHSFLWMANKKVKHFPKWRGLCAKLVEKSQLMSFNSINCN